MFSGPYPEPVESNLKSHQRLYAPPAISSKLRPYLSNTLVSASIETKTRSLIFHMLAVTRPNNRPSFVQQWRHQCLTALSLLVQISFLLPHL